MESWFWSLLYVAVMCQGTRSSYEWNEGRRIFEVRDPTNPATMQEPRSVPRLR